MMIYVTGNGEEFIIGSFIHWSFRALVVCPGCFMKFIGNERIRSTLQCNYRGPDRLWWDEDLPMATSVQERRGLWASVEVFKVVWTQDLSSNSWVSVVRPHHWSEGWGGWGSQRRDVLRCVIQSTFVWISKNKRIEHSIAWIPTLKLLFQLF